MEKKLKITTLEQFNTLIAELENKPSLAKGFQRSLTPNNFKQDWEEITLKLNSIGPPIRDSEGWQKVWRDFKCKLKKKLSHNKGEINATGGEFKQLVLSPLEEAAANFLQLEKQLNPEEEQGILFSVEYIKTENVDDMDFTISEDEKNMQSTSATAIHVQEKAISNKRKIKQKNQREKLFEKHNDIHKEISNTMTEIKTALKENNQTLEQLWECQENTLVEIKNTLKETSRHQRKLCEIEEKKMKMMEKKHQREEQIFEAEIKLKRIKIEIKKKELEVLENQYMVD